MIAFRCYASPGEDGELQSWYEKQLPRVQAAVVAVIEALSHRQRSHWRRKAYAELKGGLCTGLGEIRIEEPKGVHHRIFGFFTEDGLEFTVLYAFAKDADPDYLMACPEAQRRRRDIERDRSFIGGSRFPRAAGRGGRTG